MKNLTIENWKELTKFICALKISCYTTDEKLKKKTKPFKLQFDHGEKNEEIRQEIYYALNKVLQKIYSLNGRCAFIERFLANES